MITFKALDDNNRLRGSPEIDILTATITVTGNTVGTSNWSATEYEKPDCSQEQLSAVLPMSVASGANAAPTAVADGYSGVAGATLGRSRPPASSATTTDPDGDPMFADLVGDVSSGTLSLASDGGFTYDPDPGFIGSDSFTYQATDGSDPSGTVTVTITVTNAATTTAPDAYPASKNNLLTVPGASGVLANDTDPDTASGQPLTAVLETAPASGTLNLAADGGFTFDPPADVTGPITFTYRAFDTVALTAPETVTITIANDAPVAVDDGYATHMGTPVIAPPAATVIANDTDANGDSLTTGGSPVSGPSNGSVSLANDGTFTYTPTPLWTGTDTFTYRVFDGTDWSTPATVTVVVSNGQPVALDDSASVVHDRLVSGNVLDNDLDPDGDSLTAAIASGGGADLVLAADGSWTYTPAAGFVGSRTFTYTASDGESTSAPATVTIDVTDLAPIAVDDAWSVKHDRTLTVADPGVLAGDSDPDGDPLVATLATGPANGTLAGGVISAGGGFSYTPAAGFIGTDTFTYDVSDGAMTTTATVTITVGNTAPDAIDDSRTIRHDRTLIVPAPGLLANDLDADGDALTAALLAGPAHGVATIAASGKLTYVPTPGYVGPDSFTYSASDGFAGDVATVSIQVTNATPLATADRYVVVGDESTTVPASDGVLANDLDPDLDSLHATLVVAPGRGTIVLAASGRFIYAPDRGFVGVDSFAYVASDGIATSAPTTVKLTVIEPDPLPTSAPPPPDPVVEPSPDPSVEPSPSPTPTPEASPTAAPSSQPTPVPPIGPPDNGNPPGDTWSLGEETSGAAGGDTELPIANLAASTLGLFGSAFDWLVPGALVAGPGLLLLLVDPGPDVRRPGLVAACPAEDRRVRDSANAQRARGGGAS